MQLIEPACLLCNSWCCLCRPAKEASIRLDICNIPFKRSSRLWRANSERPNNLIRELAQLDECVCSAIVVAVSVFAEQQFAAKSSKSPQMNRSELEKLARRLFNQQISAVRRLPSLVSRLVKRLAGKLMQPSGHTGSPALVCIPLSNSTPPPPLLSSDASP